jgi:hypothetical protein
MIHVKLQVEADKIIALTELLKNSGLVAQMEVEDIDDQNLKPMTATDFYKRINASNLAQKEKRIFSQKSVEQEVAQW